VAARALAHQAGPTEPTAQAARGLAELRRIVSSLDPGGRRRRFLGGRDDGLPAGYFDRYRDAQDDLDAALAGLLAAQDGLRRANAAAEVDRGEARGALAKLTEYATLAGALDAAISRQATELDVQGQADAARALATEALPAVRQRHQDVLTHAAVVAQGYLALEVVRRHNVELIRGIERARKATASALRAAAAASAAVAGQELVLDRIRAVDTAAAGAAEGGDVDTLRAALGELAGTLDDIERYRTVAVDNLAQTAGALGPTAANPPSGGSA
jgi:uncharacterized protein YaaN involved in tellurite resistance